MSQILLPVLADGFLIRDLVASLHRLTLPLVIRM